MRFVIKYRQFLRGLVCFINYGYRKTVVDRGMLLTDFILATLLPYVLQFLIWTFIYDHSTTPINNIGFYELMFYYAFAIALGRLNNAYNTIESVSYALAEGRFDTVFLKPISLPFQKFGEFIGQSLLYWIPIIGLIFSRISLADNQIRVTQLFSIIVILFFSQILCFLLGFLLSLIAFWLERGEFILTLLSTAAAFFGGTLLPPGHWPVWIKPIMLYNPFRYMVAGPAEILSSLNFSQVETIFFGLGVYCLIFFGFTSMIWKIAQKKYSSVGG